jgi:VanZ family protein
VERPLKFFRVVFWLCFVCLTGLALSPAPYLPPLDIFNWWDKAQHAIGYGTLTASALLAYPKVSKLRVAALLCLHGCLIEVFQYFSGYRFGDLHDAAADAVGVLLSLAFFVLLSRAGFIGRLYGHSVSAKKEDASAVSPAQDCPKIKDD